MDKIKYRVWCKNRNEWEKDPVFIDSEGNLYHMMRNSSLMQCRPDTHIVQLFTGLPDSKRTDEYPEGQHICEGDVVHVWETTCTPERTLDFTSEVAFREGQFGFTKDHYGDWTQLAMVTCKGIKCEVIGNCCDNPELLEGGDSNL